MSEYLNPLHQLVRVRANGQEFNVSRATAEADHLEILDESAYDLTGAPREAARVVESGVDAGETRPAKPKVSVEDAAERKKAAAAQRRAARDAAKTSAAALAAEKAATSAADTDNPPSEKE